MDRFRKRKGPLGLPKGDANLGPEDEPGRNRRRGHLLLWSAGVLLISALIYSSSYLALFWLPPYEGMDMRSQLTADYSAWSFLVFQPVDPAILEEIQEERGLPGEVLMEEWPSPTFMAAFTATPAEANPSRLPDPVTSSPTPYPPAYTSTSRPTEIVSPATSTPSPQPGETLRPGKTRKPSKTPKPPKGPNPNSLQGNE